MKMEPRIGGQARSSREEEQIMVAMTLLDLSKRLSSKPAARKGVKFKRGQ
jgi:hypothetical protein